MLLPSLTSVAVSTGLGRRHTDTAPAHGSTAALLHPGRCLFAAGLHLVVAAVHRLGKQRQKCVLVPVVNKDRLAPVASRSAAVDRTGELDSRWAGHAGRLRGCRQKARPDPGVFDRIGELDSQWAGPAGRPRGAEAKGKT